MGWHAYCQVQLWCTATSSRPEVQMNFQVSNVRREERSDFRQLVCDVMDVHELTSVERAVVTVISGDDQGRQEMFERLVISLRV